MEKKIKFEITSSFLHIAAALFMLCDHLWGTVIPGRDWLTCIGRLAFPMPAMQVAYLIAVSSSKPSASAATKAPLKVSPAPAWQFYHLNRIISASLQVINRTVP